MVKINIKTINAKDISGTITLINGRINLDS